MSQKQLTAENYFCSECGTKNPSNALFCMECGMCMDDIHPHPEKNPSNKIKSLELTPAESLAILYIRGNNGKEMLKLTMKDLVVRKVIKIDSTEEKVLLFKKVVHRVMKGENFNVDLKPHEELFVSPLYKYPELEVKSYFRMVVKPFNSGLTGTSFLKYKNKYVVPCLMEKGYLVKVKKKGILSREKYKLTEDGLQLKKKLDSILGDADNLLELADKNPEQAKALMSVLGTHIFIFPYTMDQLLFLKNRLKGVKTKTSQFYPYVLYPLSFLMGMKAYTKYGPGRKVDIFDDDFMDDDFIDLDGDMDLFEVDVLDVFDDFDLDSLDDVCDSFDYDGGDDGGFD